MNAEMCQMLPNWKINIQNTIILYMVEQSTGIHQERVVKPVEVIPNLFYLINGEIQHRTEALGFGLKTQNYFVIFDRGSGKYKESVDNNIVSTAEGRKIIDIGTHSHRDHVGGVEGELWLPEENITVTPTGDKTASDLYNVRPQELHVTRRLLDGEVLKIDHARITVIATPGHSPDHACYSVEVNGLHFLILGDLPGGHSERIGSDLNARVRSIQKVRDIKFTHFVEGHGLPNDHLQPRAIFDSMWHRFGEKLKPSFGYLQDPLHR